MKTSSSPITWITEKQITDSNGSRLCYLNRNNQVFDDCLAVWDIFVQDWAFGICLLPCVDVFLRDSHSHVSCVWGVAVLCTFFCCGWGTGKAWRASWQPLSDEGAHHMLSYRVKHINVSNYWIQLKTKVSADIETSLLPWWKNWYVPVKFDLLFKMVSLLHSGGPHESSHT